MNKKVLLILLAIFVIIIVFLFLLFEKNVSNILKQPFKNYFKPWKKVKVLCGENQLQNFDVYETELTSIKQSKENYITNQQSKNDSYILSKLRLQSGPKSFYFDLFLKKGNSFGVIAGEYMVLCSDEYLTLNKIKISNQRIQILDEIEKKENKNIFNDQMKIEVEISSGYSSNSKQSRELKTHVFVWKHNHFQVPIKDIPIKFGIFIPRGSVLEFGNFRWFRGRK